MLSKIGQVIFDNEAVARPALQILQWDLKSR